MPDYKHMYLLKLCSQMIMKTHLEIKRRQFCTRSCENVQYFINIIYLHSHTIPHCHNLRNKRVKIIIRTKHLIFLIRLSFLCSLFYSDSLSSSISVLSTSFPHPCYLIFVCRPLMSPVLFSVCSWCHLTLNKLVN